MRAPIFIAGPTASGKTEFSILLAKKINGVVISADSMQSYKYMDIGTAKPLNDERSGIPHYMLDEYDPSEEISVSDFSLKAISYVELAFEQNKIPIIAGGSGLYIDSIAYSNYEYDGLPVDHNLRRKLDACCTNEELYTLLSKIDLDYLPYTHINNRKRNIRAIEYCISTGKKMSDMASVRVPRFKDYIYIGLKVDRPVLYERINTRVDKMIMDGLVDEVSVLYSRNKLSGTSKLAIGYKEVISYLNGECELDDAIEKIKINSRHYAKRQYTWFNRNQDIKWIDVTDKDSIPFAVQELLNGINK